MYLSQEMYSMIEIEEKFNMNWSPEIDSLADILPLFGSHNSESEPQMPQYES